MGNFDTILSKLDIKSSRGNSHSAICPAHDDHSPSLSITDDGDKLLIHCFAGCPTDYILNAVGLNMKDLYANDNQIYNNHSKTKIIAKYKYYDENGTFLYAVEKKLDINGKKSFQFYHLKDNKKVYDLKNVRRVLYRLPELMQGMEQSDLVFICEGEKDVDTLMNLGLLATTNPMGAENWLNDFNHFFTGKNIVIMQDNDEAGEKRTKKLIAELQNIAKSIKVILFKELPKGSDVTDWINTYGGNKDKLLELIDKVSIVRTNFDTVDEIRNYIYSPKNFLYRNRLVELLLQKHKIRYLHDKDLFLSFNGKYWEKSHGSYIVDYFKAWLFERDRKSGIYKGLLEDLKLNKSISLLSEEINNYPNLLNFNNTILDVKEQKAIKHSPDYYFDYVIDYDYDPIADCPTFKKLLEDYSLGDENWILLLQEIGGYILLDELPYQKMFWFFSNTGRNGKGTILRVMHSILGNIYVLPGFDTKQLKDSRFYKRDLRGKRLIYSGDMENQIFALNELKSLTGGDMQLSDVKYGDSITFPIKGKFIFSMNNLPQIHNDENKEPLRKRIIFLPFFYQIENPNTKVEQQLQKERSGILNFFIEGLQRLLNNEQFTETKLGKLISKVFMEDNDILEVFLDEYLKYDEKAEGLHLTKIFQHYKSIVERISNRNTIKNHFRIINKDSKDISDHLTLKYPDISKTQKPLKKDNGEKGNYTFIKNIKFSEKLLEVI